MFKTERISMQSMESTGIKRMDGGFPKGFAKTIGGANLLFGISFVKNCMKINNIGVGGGELARIAPDPPLQW